MKVIAPIASEVATGTAPVSVQSTTECPSLHAATTTALHTARNINGVPFDGTGDITVPAAGSTLTDTVPITKGGTGQITAGPAYDALSIHGADVPSAATTNLDTATGNLIDVTGTVTITAITLSDGRERTVRFTGALILTNGASLVLPGGVNITTVAGDIAIFRGYAAGVVRCSSYSPITVTGTGAGVKATSPVFTTPNIGVAAATSLTTTGVIELGNATDTTVARASAGVVTIEGKPVLSSATTTLSANTTLSDIHNEVLVDTTAGDVSITLPAAPFSGQTFSLKKIVAANTLTILRNGNNINGVAADLTTIDTLSAITLVYDTTNKWRTLVGTTTPIAQLADGAATGGNPRGTGAVDFQTSRVGANQVASGAQAMLLGGTNCSVAGSKSIVGGDGCSAAAALSVAMGDNCSVTAGSSGVAIGSFITISGAKSAGFGYGHSISSQYSLGLGYQAAPDWANTIALSPSQFASVGDAQALYSSAKAQTTNATQTLMTNADTGPFTVAQNCAMLVTVLIVARRTDVVGESAAYQLQFCIDRDTTAASTALVGNLVKTALAEDTAAWDVTAIADTTLGAFKLLVTGQAAKTINWVANIVAVKAKGP